MAYYEDSWNDDMNGFSDDLEYYDEERGFYDDFQERLDEPEDEPMMAEEPAATGAQGVDRDFHETINTDDVVADQLEDPGLHNEAKQDYSDADPGIIDKSE